MRSCQQVAIYVSGLADVSYALLTTHVDLWTLVSSELSKTIYVSSWFYPGVHDACRRTLRSSSLFYGPHFWVWCLYRETLYIKWCTGGTYPYDRYASIVMVQANTVRSWLCLLDLSDPNV